MIVANNKSINLLPESKQFVIALFTKIGNEYLERQKNAYDEESSEAENLSRITEAMRDGWSEFSELANLAEMLEVKIKPYSEVDEEVLNTKSLSDFIINVVEIGMAHNTDISYEVRRVRDLYSMAVKPPEAITNRDNIMTHIALISNEDSEVDELDIDAPAWEEKLEIDEEELEKYISLFSGEEYDNDGESN